MYNIIIGSRGFLSNEIRQYSRINNWLWFSSANSGDAKLDIFDSSTFQNLKEVPINTCLILSWPFLPNYESDIHLTETLPAIKVLIDSLVECNVKHIIGVGSCLEYGCRNGCLDESDEAEGYMTPYGEAKSIMKTYLVQKCESNTINWTWIRPFYLFSPNQRKNALYPSILKHISLSLDSIEVNSNVSRDFISAHKFVELIDACIDEPLSYNKSINCCSGAAMKVSQFAQELINLHGSNLVVKEVEGQQRSYEPSKAWGNNDRMMQILLSNGPQ